MLVTGASGFVGRAVISAFAERGHTLRAAVRAPAQHSFGADVELVEHPDLAKPFDWEPMLVGVDTVIHLAGIAHTNAAPELCDRVNLQATARLAADSTRAGVKRFVFISSIRAQAGPTADRTLTERDAPVPAEAYGRSKLAAEAAVRAAGVPFTILRPVLLYGPGVKGNFAYLLRVALSPWPLPVGDFTNRRSLLGIDNFISVLCFVLSTPTTIGETYVVADPGMPPRLVDIVKTLREAQGRRPFVLPLPPRSVEILLRLLRRTDLWERVGGNLQADPGKLIAAGWQPVHDTRKGLASLIQPRKPQ